MTELDPPHERRSELRRRRDELAELVAELQWNLGGLTYEMAIRDHFRVDVLVRRAAMLQERDAELAEVERLLHMQESAVVGNCANCGAVRSRGAVFCWQCGTQMMERSAAPGNNEALTVDSAAPANNEALTVDSAAPANDEALTVEIEATTAQTGVAESDAKDVEIDIWAVEGERDRPNAQTVPAPLDSPQETASQGSIPSVATHGGESALGRPVQTGS
jgi:uncharacterized Zn finger protein (UPF0148 family)